MNPVQTQFLEAVAGHIGVTPIRAEVKPERFCLKCRRWCDPEGGSGSGRQYRCVICAQGRRNAMQKRRQERAAT